MNVSLDLKIERAAGEQGSGSWLRIGEELHREFNARARALAMMIQGRVVYEIMERFWPNAAQDETLPDYLREYGQIWTEAPKVLVSSTRAEAPHHTRVIGGDDAMEQLAHLRAQTPGTIGVGGATLATQLLHRGLLDELLLFVHPVVLGSGRPLFDDIPALIPAPIPAPIPVPIECELIEHARFDRGVTMQRLAIRSTTAV